MAVVIIILFISLGIPAFLFRRSFYEQVKTRRLLKKGIEAQAILLNVKQTGIYLNRQPHVKLQMQVYPTTGRNFVVEVCEVINYADLKQLQIGDAVLVKYNPSNTKEVMILML